MKSVAGRRPRVATLGVAVALGLLLTGCGSGSTSTASHASSRPSGSQAADSYGSLPSFLPSDSITPDSVLTGTLNRPALTTEGDNVIVKTAQGSVLASVAGPEVPGEGLPYEGDATACTWTVTLSHASTTIPITVADFTSLDHLGNVYKPALVAGQPKPPATLAPGRSVTFELRARMIVGEGLMRWAPNQRILASWDFEVEND